MTTNTMYELRTFQSRKPGLFATKTINRGDRIIAEDVLLMTGMAGLTNPIALYDAYLYLKERKPKECKAFMSLNHTITNELNVIKDFISKPHREQSASKIKKSINEAAKVKAIFDQHHIQTVDKTSFVVPYMGSRINHSCAPNVALAYSKAIDKFTVYAMRNISRDEELCSAYISPMLSHATRLLMLDGGGIKCQCIACLVNKRIKNTEASEKRRVQLENLNTKLDDQNNPPSDREREAIYLEMVNKILPVEPCMTAQYATTRKKLGELYKKQGSPSKALEQLDWALGLYEVCFGKDGDETKLCRKLRDSVKG